MTDNYYHIISIEDLIAFEQHKQDVPPNAVIITFDDGYESFYKYAYPVLKERHMTATNFVIVGYVNDGQVHKPVNLTWDEIIEMHKDGFSFYSHTYNSHTTIVEPDGTKETPLTNHLLIDGQNRMETDEEYSTRIKEDLTKANQILQEKLGDKLDILCLPHGRTTPELSDIAAQTGIEYIFTGVDGINIGNERDNKRIIAGQSYVSDSALIWKLGTFSDQLKK